MNYQELKKLHDEYLKWDSCEINPMNLPLGVKGKDFLAWIDHRRYAQSDFERHCIKKFDKALEALKQDVDPLFVVHGDECDSRGPAPYEGKPSDDGCDCWVADRRRLIAELERVN